MPLFILFVYEDKIRFTRPFVFYDKVCIYIAIRSHFPRIKMCN